MCIRLPSRYEDLDVEFRGRLKADRRLLELVQAPFKSMEISGGIRFLPIFGQSGSGKTSATLEIGTHLPDLYVVQLSRDAIESAESLKVEIQNILSRKRKGVVAIIDQYEEVAAQRSSVPKLFVESLSLLDRGDLRNENILFIWLTTNREFQSSLVEATSRNKRILVAGDFELHGPPQEDWPQIISETFQFHNQNKDLSDFEIIDADLHRISQQSQTIGESIESTGTMLGKFLAALHDISDYQVLMLWPVTDGLRISRIQQFTDARQGYKLDWVSWYRQLNSADQVQLPLREFNRARLYFDMRLVPIAVADLHPLCKNLDDDDYELHKTYLDRFILTHFASIVMGKWSSDAYSPLRERVSKRATEARNWYETVTQSPTKIGKRVAMCFKKLGIDAAYEESIESRFGKIRADVLIRRARLRPQNIIVELKAFSPENTMPSTICTQIQTTFRRHAQFAGFLQRQ